MHPLLCRVGLTLAYCLLCLLAGAGLALWLQPGGHLLSALPLTLPLSLISGFMLLSAHYVCHSLPYGQRRPTRVLLLFGSAALLAAAIITLLARAWGSLLQLLSAPYIPLLPAWGCLLVGTLLYLLSLLLHEILFAFDNVRVVTARSTALRTLAQEAELQVLRTQVSPHFLFNCLNSVSALITLDPVAARDMTLELAAFFRSTLKLSAEKYIPLQQEIALCRHFLAIEQRRFGDRLHYRLESDEQAERCLVPPMCLQPLLENALKHGSGSMQICVAVRDGWLHVQVENPIVTEHRPAHASGLGLANLQQRLTLLYGSRARLLWQCQPQHFRVELTVPYREGEPDHDH